MEGKLSVRLSVVGRGGEGVVWVGEVERKRVGRGGVYGFKKGEERESEGFEIFFSFLRDLIL